MKKLLRGLLVVFVLLAAIGALSSAWASLNDEEVLDLQGRAATLMVSVGAGESMDTGISLGENLKPGDSGSVPITIINEGTIDGVVCAQVQGEIPYYLSVNLENICGDVLGAGEQTTIMLNWTVLDVDMGTGGQTFDLSVRVSIEQP
jgi:hypothetical protein